MFSIYNFSANTITLSTVDSVDFNLGAASTFDIEGRISSSQPRGYKIAYVNVAGTDSWIVNQLRAT